MVLTINEFHKQRNTVSKPLIDRFTCALKGYKQEGIARGDRAPAAMSQLTCALAHLIASIHPATTPTPDTTNLHVVVKIVSCNINKGVKHVH